MMQQTGDATATIELNEEKRKAKEALLSRLRDELTASKVRSIGIKHDLSRLAQTKADQLDDELAKQAQKANQMISRLKAELENVKGEREIAIRDRRDLDERLNAQLEKMRVSLAHEETKVLDLQKV